MFYGDQDASTDTFDMPNALNSALGTQDDSVSEDMQKMAAGIRTTALGSIDDENTDDEWFETSSVISGSISKEHEKAQHQTGPATATRTRDKKAVSQQPLGERRPPSSEQIEVDEPGAFKTLYYRQRYEGEPCPLDDNPEWTVFTLKRLVKEKLGWSDARIQKWLDDEKSIAWHTLYIKIGEGD